MIVGPIGMTSIVHYYTGRGRCESFRIDTADAPTIVRLVDSRRPDLLILRTTRRLDAAGCEELVARMKARGFSVVDPVPRPPGSDPVVVLVRDRGAARVASRAAR
jgi:hypothetical protein